ncbi:unnamed protein product [Meganyctiphanes norvegica]|uniref:Uncharacterized protein n=1 Tax=Meganyctiphanes norvegica TaxID=48144 RepID=A0AAV2Q2X5_MEGNR
MDCRITLLVFPILFFCHGADAWSITCYSCTNDPHLHGSAQYDADCGEPNYDGYYGTSAPTDQFKRGCATIIYDNGYIWRGWATDTEVAGEVCQHTDWQGSGLQCWCMEDKCNAHLCDECFDTTTTTVATTTTTTTQQPPSKGLSCYSCVDCPTVDESTTVVFDEDFLTCVTIMTCPETVVRSGGLDAYPDGECYVNDGTILFCHCTTSLCNRGASADMDGSTLFNGTLQQK